MSFSWLPQQSSYARLQAWSANQRAWRQDAEDKVSFANDTIASALTDQIAGMATLSAQAALKRTRNAAQAKLNSNIAAANADSGSSSRAKDTSPVTLRDGTVIKNDPIQYLPGGSKLNIDTGTLTLANGTVIDTKTGARKVDVSV